MKLAVALLVAVMLAVEVTSFSTHLQRSEKLAPKPEIEVTEDEIFTSKLSHYLGTLFDII